MNPGDIGLMKSATEGNIRARIIDVRGGFRLWPPPGPSGESPLRGFVIGGQGPEEIEVEFLEGKHKGEQRWVPANYVVSSERLTPEGVETLQVRREPLGQMSWRDLVSLAKQRGISDAEDYSKAMLKKMLE